MSRLKKKLFKKTTDIEDCSVCNEEEISATENSVETHETLFTTKSELNLLSLKLTQKAPQDVLCKVVIKGK